MAHLATEPKSMWCQLQKTKTQCQFGARKGLSIEKAPTEKMGDVMVPQIHLACSTRLRGWGNRCAKVLVGQVLIGGPWMLDIHGKGVSTQLDNGSLVSESGLVFKFQLCPGPLVPWVGETLVLSAAGGKMSLLSAYPGCMTCGLGLLSLKSNSVSHQTG